MGKDFVSMDDLRKLNNADLIPKRFRILYNALFRTGMRPGEMLKIKPTDFHKETDDKGTLRIYIDLRTQKNKTENELTPIPIQDYTDILDYVRYNNIRDFCYIFGSSKFNYSKAPTVSWLGRKLHGHLKLLGIDKHITPHSFRSGLVTYLLDQGKSYPEIANITRHQNLGVMKKHYDKRYKKRGYDLVKDINIF